jgi:hypothetical protein
MKWRIILAVLLLLVVSAGSLAWHLLGTGVGLGSGEIIEASSGHAYRYIAAPNIRWDEAREAAARQSWRGHPGYLATIDDSAEYQFVVDRLFPTAYPDVTYLGGRQTAPGEWRWVTGPDGKADGGKGTLFWRGDEQGAPKAAIMPTGCPQPFSMKASGMSRMCAASRFFPTACRNSPPP